MALFRRQKTHHPLDCSTAPRNSDAIAKARAKFVQKADIMVLDERYQAVSRPHVTVR